MTRSEAQALAAKMRATGILENVHVTSWVDTSRGKYWFVTARGPDVQHGNNPNINLDSEAGLETYLRILPEKYKRPPLRNP